MADDINRIRATKLIINNLMELENMFKREKTVEGVRIEGEV